jgi:hypothetical protein
MHLLLRNKKVVILKIREMPFFIEQSHIRVWYHGAHIGDAP